MKVNNPYGNGLKPGDFTLKMNQLKVGVAPPQNHFKVIPTGTDIKFTGNAFYKVKKTLGRIWDILIDYESLLPRSRRDVSTEIHMSHNF